jgi:beta-1,4-mannosyl-glycoprotein beta-1,4-N-acetylglucosaminyltransferase
MRVIDCFPYNGETIALFRLEYLWNVVDEFVVVEAGETHAGQKKDALFLDRNAALLQPFAGKITRLVIERFPTPTEADLAPLTHPKSKTSPAAWFREKYQRNFAGGYLRALSERQPWILLGCDVDEIPRRALVATLPDRYDALNAGFRMQMSFFYYSSRWIKRTKWTHPFVVNDRVLQHETLDGLRGGAFIRKCWGDAGWHLSYFMTNAELQRKIASFAHTEVNSDEVRDLEWIQQCRKTGHDLYRRGAAEDCLPYTGDDLPAGLRAFEARHGISV